MAEKYVDVLLLKNNNTSCSAFVPFRALIEAYQEACRVRQDGFEPSFEIEVTKRNGEIIKIQARDLLAESRLDPGDELYRWRDSRYPPKGH